MHRHAILLAIAAAAAPALAQVQPANDILAGPTVQITPAPPTHEKRDFNGSLIRPDMAIEEAALELLDLTAEERAAAQIVLDKRAAILDGVVADNLELLIQFNGAADGNPRVHQGCPRLRRQAKAPPRPRPADR